MTISFECSNCDGIIGSVEGSVSVTFRATVVAVPAPHLEQIELGISSCANPDGGLVVEIDTLICPMCREPSHPDSWKLHVSCVCGRGIRVLEPRHHDELLKETYCIQYHNFLCENCWKTISFVLESCG